MIKLTVRLIAVVAISILVGLGWVGGAAAAGAVNISTCQILSGGNTTYKVTADLNSNNDDFCLVVAADKITIDLQGHTITGNGAGVAGISDAENSFDVVTVKNGTVTGYLIGIFLAFSTRVSVLAVTATENFVVGIWTGDQGLVKSSTATFNLEGGIVVGDRSQVQQCTANNNGSSGSGSGIVALDNCLLTMNTTNDNAEEGIATGSNCTVSFNTANNNGDDGIDVGADGDLGGTGSLVTQNTAVGNADNDYHVACPSTVTYNTSSGAATSYNLEGPGCHVGNNN